MTGMGRTYKRRGLRAPSHLGVSTHFIDNPQVMYNGCMPYEFDNIDRIIGGASRSAAKVAAARRNGALGGKYGIQGGRKPTRTLAERLLGRTLRTASERAGFKEALQQLLARERQELLGFFGVHSENAVVPVIPKLTRISNEWRPPLKGRARERVMNPTVSVLHSKQWRQSARRQPREIRYLIRKLKLAASQFIPPAS